MSESLAAPPKATQSFKSTEMSAPQPLLPLLLNEQSGIANGAGGCPGGGSDGQLPAAVDLAAMLTEGIPMMARNGVGTLAVHWQRTALADDWVLGVQLLLPKSQLPS